LKRNRLRPIAMMASQWILLGALKSR
jgi:hypothetical protein